MAANTISGHSYNHLSCPVCHELYKKPKYLPCCHSYCEECLEKLKAGSNITCLVCKDQSEVPVGGLKVLPNHHFFSRIVDEMTIRQKIGSSSNKFCSLCIKQEVTAVALCTDCGHLLCSTCYDYHKVNITNYQGHQLALLNEVQSKKKDISKAVDTTKWKCQDHDMQLNSYCKTCKQLVCDYCTITEHSLEVGHDHDPVKKMADMYRLEMVKVMARTQEKINGLIKVIEKISSDVDAIGSQATEVEQQIDAYYKQLQQQLQQQRDNLKKELYEVSTQKKKALSLQLVQMKSLLTELQSTNELNKAVKNGLDQETLFMQNQIAEDEKRLAGDHNSLNTEPVELPNMKFIKEYEKSFSHFGNMFYGYDSLFNVAVPLNIPGYVQVGKQMSFRLLIKDRDRHPCSGKRYQISIMAQPRRGDIISVPINDNQDGTYTAFFIANKTGALKLSVTVNGQHITGSPYSVRVLRQYCELGRPTNIINNGGRMGQSRCVAFCRDGTWAIADYANCCICMFDSQNQLIRKLGSYGTGNGQFSSPAGLAFDAINHLYVVDNGNKRVQKFDENGRYLLSFKNGPGGQLNSPFGITTSDDIVLVTDYGNRCILVFQCDGQFIQIIGSGQLSSPYDVAVTNNNQVLVADYGNHCISIFTIDGNYVGKIGSQGRGRGQLSRPSSVTVDLNGFIMVTEEYNHRVSIFDKDNAFVHCFGSSGSSAGQFSYPCGISCSPNGEIFVCDGRNNRVQIFST